MSRNTSVKLGHHFDRFVAEKIEQGHYQSASEVVRGGLRKLEEYEARLEALRSKLKVGQESPMVNDFNVDSLLNHLHGKHL